jgi:hypothetical protein
VTREAAIKKLRRVLGAKAYYRIGEHVTSPERRRRHTLAVLDASFRSEMARRARDERREAILAADAEYCTLKAEARAAYDAFERARYHDHDAAYRFEVGTLDGIFRHTLAHGDTWEEVFSALDARTAGAKSE